VPFAVADAGDPDGSQLPQVMVADLGYGDPELVPYPAGDGLYYLSLALEGQVFRQAQGYPAYAHVHLSVSPGCLGAIPV
jgi:hypothetical protein